MSVAAPAALAQQPTIVRGRVIAAENDRPLRRARVITSPGEIGSHHILTDDDGEFDAPVRDSSQPLLVTKAGYAAAWIDLRREKATADRKIEVRLSKSAAISGRVTDDAGSPLVGVRVDARRLDGSDADRKWMQGGETDDRGEYRIGGLAAGKYEISLGAARLAIPNEGMAAAVAPLAGAPIAVGARQNPQAPARSVDLEPGDDIANVDVMASVWSTFDQSLREMKALLERNRGEAPRGRITGRVMTTTGDTVGRAEVRASRTNLLETGPSVATRSSAVTTTDASGRFSVELLDDGEYQLEASKDAHVVADDRVPSGPMQRVRVVNGVAEQVQLVLSRGGAISGTIVDSAGEPLQGVRVTALRLVGESDGHLGAIPTGWGRITDDRGRYRVFGLPSGSYLMAVSTEAESSGMDRTQQREFTQTYFPGTTRIDGAQPLRLLAGAELAGLDVSITPTFTARVSGQLFDGAGEPLAGRVQLAISRHSSAITAEPMTASVHPDGTFEFRGVPPGDYVLQATSEPGFGRPPQFAVESVVVGDRNPAPVTIRTSSGTTLEGRFIVEGMADPPLRALAIHASSADFDRAPRAGRGPTGLAVHDDGRFYLTGLQGPMRFSATSLPSGWYLKSVTIAGGDVTDVPFDFGSSAQTLSDAEIVLSPEGATIAGVVTDGPSTRASNFVAVAFSTSRDRWFNGSRQVKQRRSEANGSFTIDGLPPGEYWVAAVDRLEPGSWLTPDNLDALVPSAARVTVSEGQALTTGLRLLRRVP